MSVSNDTAEIAGIIERFVAAFCVVDSEAMKTFFAQDYPDIVHQSEENPRALTSYEEIARYWDHQVAHDLEAIPLVEDTDLKIHVIGDVALVYLYAVATVKMPGAKALWKAPFRATIALRRLEGAWKIIQYHESRILDMDRLRKALNAGEADQLAYGAAQA